MSDQFLEIDDTDDEETSESDSGRVAIEDLLVDEDGETRRSRTSDSETEDYDAQAVYADSDAEPEDDAEDASADGTSADDDEDADGKPADDLEEEAAELDDPAEAEAVFSDVLPKQKDEFVCSSCFLVQHNSRRAGSSSRCRECD